jgi:hypothetical protein
LNEALVSMYRTKLSYKGIPEKDNLTNGMYGHTNGKKGGIFCFFELAGMDLFRYRRQENMELIQRQDEYYTYQLLLL